MLFPRRRSPGFEIRWHAEIHLTAPYKRCSVDGDEHRVKNGNWMFFLPKSGEKFFHTRNGIVDCIHSSRPLDLSRDCSDATYAGEEWRNALTTPVDARLAEVFVASRRLWKAGLGPKPLGLTFADRLYRDDVALGPTMGIISEDVSTLPRKSDCSIEDMIEAGVRPDKIRSCTRQQMNGYVIDLCSVVGVQPIDADEEVRSTRAWIAATKAMTVGMQFA